MHATLVWTALELYDRFVVPLSRARRAAYLVEMSTFGRLFGVPDRLLFTDYDRFEDYVRGVDADGVLAVGPHARAAAAQILTAGATDLPRPLPAAASRAAGLLAAGLLPPRLRAGYQLPWGPREAQSPPHRKVGWLMAGEQDGAPETEQAAVDLSGTQAASVAQAALGPKVLGRHRRHQFPAREHLVKVRYATDERRAVEQAAEVRGLRTSSYVGMAALEMAQSLLQGCRAGDAPPEAGASGRRRVREDQELSPRSARDRGGRAVGTP